MPCERVASFAGAGPVPRAVARRAHVIAVPVVEATVPQRHLQLYNACAAWKSLHVT